MVPDAVMDWRAYLGRMALKLGKGMGWDNFHLIFSTKVGLSR
jgi:hypothetical protein